MCKAALTPTTNAEAPVALTAEENCNEQGDLKLNLKATRKRGFRMLTPRSARKDTDYDSETEVPVDKEPPTKKKGSGRLMRMLGRKSPRTPRAVDDPSPEGSGKVEQETERAEKEQAEATAKIQAIQRGNAARKQAEERREQKDATEKQQSTTRIQAIQRGNAARKGVQEKKEQKDAAEKEQATTRIQAIQRGNAARKEVQEQKDAAAPATTQEYFKDMAAQVSSALMGYYDEMCSTLEQSPVLSLLPFGTAKEASQQPPVDPVTVTMSADPLTGAVSVSCVVVQAPSETDKLDSYGYKEPARRHKGGRFSSR